jgi:AcrR family transcriptional regulator
MSDTSYHHGNLQQAIIDQAASMLRDDQNADLSLRKIAREIGVSHQAPYRHFATKDDVLAAVRADGFDRLTRTVQSAIAQHPRSRRLQLETATWAYVRSAIDNPAVYQLMFGGEIESKLWGDRQRDCAGESLAALASILCLDSSIPVDASALHRARLIWATMHGLASLKINGFLGRDERQVRSMVTDACEFWMKSFESLRKQ